MAEVPVQPQSTSQSIKWKNIIIGIVTGTIIIGLGVLGFIFYQNQITPKQKTTPISISFSTRPRIETANWKTYTNTKYSYKIKYPIDWSIEPYPPQGTLLSTADGVNLYNSKDPTIYTPNQIIFGISFYPNPSDTSLEEFLKLGDINIFYPLIYEWISPKDELGARKSAVKGMAKTSFQDFEALNDGKTRLFVNTRENIILFYISAPNDSVEDPEDLFDQFLSTFELIN